MRGKFIVIEGIDGSGKGTQTDLLVKFLEDRGIKTKTIHYPEHGNPIGDFIYDFLKKKFDLNRITQFLMYTADMTKDVEKIEQWLEEGYYVIADRYFTTTLAYQGLHLFSLEDCLPLPKIFNMTKADMVVYLKITPDTSLARKSQQKEMDRFEEDKEFQSQLVVHYEKLENENVLGNWIRINGEKTIPEVFEEVKKASGF
ncbi:MAG: dTMP kinase [Candidatus Aenigmatarchaeota archaeon]